MPENLANRPVHRSGKWDKHKEGRLKDLEGLPGPWLAAGGATEPLEAVHFLVPDAGPVGSRLSGCF